MKKDAVSKLEKKSEELQIKVEGLKKQLGVTDIDEHYEPEKPKEQPVPLEDLKKKLAETMEMKERLIRNNQDLNAKLAK